MEEFKRPEHYTIMEQVCAGLYDRSVYIEIGASDGAAFNRIAPMFERKIAVDIAPVGHFLCEGAEFYQMTSDDFFKYIATSIPAVSAIFIDGDHRKEFVLRDIQNSLNIIAPYRGVIFAHDVYPPSLEMIHGGCWDAWEAAVEMRKVPEVETLILPVTCMGIGLFRKIPSGGNMHWMS